MSSQTNDFLRLVDKEGFYYLLQSTILEFLQEVSDKLFCKKAIEQDENIYFHVSGSLTSSNFERAVIIAETWREDKNSLHLTTYNKAPELIIISPSDEEIAKKIVQEYTKWLPRGYQIDNTLVSREWYIKFSPKIADKNNQSFAGKENRS